ncbi:2-acylglycerol O-acyltransferase 1-like [Tribolium madens]|uniref:2-acylglycerol O-acyltransferase 1-like n=1 Tax=Tribolium madens TaxID=41895 RepID=UPI001CF75747|nr:2-acylglycerol O-acyltransferase 1-like [Tribolium madens]
MRILGIIFDPWDTPFEQRLQMFAAGAIYFGFIFIGPLLVIFCFYLLSTSLWWLVLLYFGWFYFDKHTPERGSRPSQWLQNLKFWKYVHDHFLITLRLAPGFELNPSKNYLFACFPHGVLPMGVFSTIVNSYSLFHNLYPNFRVKIATLSVIFWFPLLRDFAMCLGFISASFKSLTWVLSRPEKGEIVVLFPGGAVECSYNQFQPELYKCFVKRRRGFVKVALKTGAALVPVLTFGENDLLAVEGSFLQKFRFVTKRFPILACGLFNGRGVFQNSFGMVPRKKPIMTVVGRPIEVSKTENPGDEEIDNLYKKFEEELLKLFEKYKHKFFDNPQTKCLELE